MTIFYAAILALAVGANDTPTANSTDAVVKPSETSTAAADKADSTANYDALFPSRKPSEMRKRVTDSLRAAAEAKSAAQRDQTTRQLMLVFLELEQDKSLTHDERVELHTQVRSRLAAIEKTLRAEMAHGKQGAPPTVAAKSLVSTGPTANTQVVDASKTESLPDAAKVNLAALAQMIAPANAQQARGVVGGGIGVGVQQIGGQQFANGNQTANAAGLELVDLIQRVIAPRTWDINGGPGSIVYYPNLRVLVVTAPSEVHSQLGDALGQLRK
ncbi:MAG TPA: hypothetical protein VGJ15_09195 [Pirellulales bacterium]|jgi:hypothetical protein